jgi:quercetin dioxygenase-like cupin family protein
MNKLLQTVILFSLFTVPPTMSADEISQAPPNNVKYTRIVVDAAGDSHFAEAEVPMVLASYAQPEPKVGLSPTYEASSVTFFSAPPGYFGDWHTAVRKQFLFHLSGSAEIVVSDGESRIFRTGDILLVEDTTGKGHTARIVGDEAVLIAAVPAVIGDK